MTYLSKPLLSSLLVSLVAFACQKRPVAPIVEDDAGAEQDAGSEHDADHQQEHAEPANERERRGYEVCCLLGALCHPVSEDTKAGECHDLGHVNDPEACLDVQDECTMVCEGLQEMLEGGPSVERHACIEPPDAGQ